jgi:hypothetical protein
MDCVKAYSLEWSQTQGFYCHDGKPGAMNARQYVAGETSARRVGLDDGERAFLLGFGGHGFSYCSNCREFTHVTRDSSTSSADRKS